MGLRGVEAPRSYKFKMKSNQGSVFLGLLIGVGIAIVASIVVALVIFVVTYLFIARPYQMVGKSMQPTYEHGQYILANSIAYKFGEPERGDIVILSSPKNADIDFIERIIGLPGERIKISQGRVYINGEALKESGYLPEGTETGSGNFLKEGEEVVIPEGKYVVMGDNRGHSADSREFGFIDREKIYSRVAFCYWNCK